MIQDHSGSLILLDILRGYSVFSGQKKKVYFKHFTLIELLELDEFEQEAYQEALRKGVKSEKELIDHYIKIGKWGDKQEEKIKTLEWMVGKSEAALAKITDQNQKRVFEKSLESQREELKHAKDEREKLLNYSAEALASGKRYKKLLADALFYDQTFKKPVGKTEGVEFYNQCMVKIGELSKTNNILKAAYHPSFFEPFSINKDNPFGILGVDIYSVTSFQKNLFSYAMILRNKIDHMDIPREIMNDPRRIFDFKPSEKNEGGRKVTEGVDDLKEKLKQKGKLTGNDLIA